MSNVTNECPYCGDTMEISRMSCGNCRVAVESEFPSCRLASLPTEHQRFVEMFVLAAGNLKTIAEETGVSYPTIRSRLNKVIDGLRDEIRKAGPTRGNVLDAVINIEEPPKAKQSVVAESAGKLIKRI